jgi:hypothetical protein
MGGVLVGFSHILTPGLGMVLVFVQSCGPWLWLVMLCGAFCCGGWLVGVGHLLICRFLGGYTILLYGMPVLHYLFIRDKKRWGDSSSAWLFKFGSHCGFCAWAGFLGFGNGLVA